MTRILAHQFQQVFFWVQYYFYLCMSSTLYGPLGLWAQIILEIFPHHGAYRPFIYFRGFFYRFFCCIHNINHYLPIPYFGYVNSCRCRAPVRRRSFSKGSRTGLQLAVQRWLQGKIVCLFLNHHHLAA